MIGFLLGAAVLVIVTLAGLLRPWWRSPAAGGDVAAGTAGDLNRRVHRDQWDELQRDRAVGLIGEREAAVAERELQRRLLEEDGAGLDAASSRTRRVANAAGDADAAPVEDAAHGANEAHPAHVARANPRQAARTPWVLAVVVPVAASAGYAVLGHPEALLGGPVGTATVASVRDEGAAAVSSRAVPDVPAEAGAGAGTAAVTGAGAGRVRVQAGAGAGGAASAFPGAGRAAAGMPDIGAMVARLAERLRTHPDDPAGWTMMARAQRALGHAAQARDAFEHIGPTLQDDPTLLAQYADTRAVVNGGPLDEVGRQALQRCLRLDPANPVGLSLAATMAFNAGDRDEAARQWQRLLAVLPPDSPEAGRVRAFLERVGRPAAGATGSAPGPAKAAAARPSSTASRPRGG